MTRVNVNIREAVSADIPALADCHLRAWQAGYRGILPDDLLDDLEHADFERSWRSHLSSDERFQSYRD